MGACRREELSNITVQDIKEYESSMFLVTLPITKTHMARTFTITDKFYQIVKKYQSLRPLNLKCDRFFLNHQNGKCTQQPIGINKFGSMPKLIASYLNLPDPNSYTGHSFRRTSATLLAEAGADIITLKRHGGWKSNTVAEGYIEQSLSNKKKISEQIGHTVNIINQEDIDTPSSSKEQQFSTEKPPKKLLKLAEKIPDVLCESISHVNQIKFPTKNVHFSINNCTNVSIHFHEK